MPLFDKNIPYEPYDDSLAGIEIPDSYSIIGIYKDKYGIKNYVLECDKCRNVSYLQGRLFSSKKSMLKKGYCPCGCSNKMSLDEEADIIRIKDRCDALGYLFIGFNGLYNGSRTKLLLRCLKHDKTWDTATISNFFSGHGCNLCGIEKRALSNSLPQSSHIEAFKSAGILNATFIKLPNDYWHVTCHDCGKVFKGTTYHLKEGKRGCVCSGRYKKTEEEYTLSLYSKLLSMGNIDKIVNFSEYPVNRSAKVNILCSNCNTIYSRYIRSILEPTSNCKCACSSYPDQIYGYVNLVKDGDLPMAFKFGIESIYLNRTYTQNIKTHLDVSRLITYKFKTPTLCRQAENKVKETLKNYLSKRDLPDGFTETCAPTENNLNFIKSIYNEFGGEIFE